MRDQLVKRTKKGLRKYKSMVRKLKSSVNEKMTNPKVVKSKAAAVVMSLAKVSRPVEGESVIINVVSRTDIHSLKSRKNERIWPTQDWKWRLSANVDPVGWKIKTFPDEYSDDETVRTTQRGRVQPHHCAQISPHR